MVLPGSDGLDQINTKIPIPTIDIATFNCILNELMRKIGKAKLAKISIVAIILGLLRMIPCCCQSIIGFDRVGCVISHWWNRSDPLAKQAAAKSRNGVVGSRGVTIPIAPMRTKKHPKLT